jgi:hypothetical protein
MMPAVRRSEVTMRRPRSFPLFCMFCAILAATLFGVVGRVPSAHAQPAPTADQRAQARDHYMAGKRLYDAGAYQQAIGEFTAADQLSPSGMNDFNIAFCYEKLGDASNAVAHYQAYLTRVPDAQNRAAVEASIAKLADAAKKQEADAAAKKAADDAAAKAAADAAAAKTASDAAAAKAASDAAAAAAASAKTNTPPGGPGGAGGTVAPAPPAHTGDPDLDKIASVDINTIRDQRHPVGPAVQAPAGSVPGATGTAAVSTGSAVAPVPGASTGPTPGAPTAVTTNASGAGNGGPSQAPHPGAPEQTADKPVYRKWWFWVIVGVGAIVAINVFSSSPQSGQTNGALMNMPTPAPQPGGGLTLWHF